MSKALVIKTLGEAQEQIEIVNKFSQRRVEVNVLVDPTPAELMGFLKRTSHGICRAVYTRRPQYQQYVWDAYLANHDEMLRTLREQWGVDIGSDPMQLEYSTVDPETDQIGMLNGEFYQMGSIWVTYAPPFLRSRFAKTLGKMASGALVESQQRPLQQMIADFRAGYVYHGTTRLQAEQILDHGFRTPSFDQLVQEVAAKMAMKVTPKIMDQLRDERRYYERDGQPMVSTAFSPEIAGRWAGSGGETIKQIEQVLSGRRLNWGHPDSSFSGPKTVLRVHLNEAGRKMPAYLRMAETVDRVEQLMASGKYDEEDGWDTLANTYFDIRVQPDQIDDVEIVE